MTPPAPRLATRLTWRIATAVVGAFTCAAVLNYLWMARQASVLVEEKADTYLGYLVGTLEIPLWLVDEASVARIAGAYLRDPAVSWVEVVDESDGRSLFHQSRAGVEVTRTTREATVTHRGEPIGRVCIGFTGVAYDRAKDQLVSYSVVTVAVVATVMALATGGFVRRLLSGPLEALVRALEEVEGGRYDHALPDTPVREFEVISLRFGAMAQRVRAREADLRAANDRLTGEVQRRESTERRLRAILDGTTSVVFLKDVQGRYLLVNRRWVDLFGVTDDEVRGHTDYHLFPADAADAFTAHDRDVLEQGRLMEFEEVVPHDDGPHTYISVKFPVAGPQPGTVEGVCGISTDITDRKRASAEVRRLRNLLANVIDSMPAVVAGVDGQWRITIWNREAERVTGRKNAEAHGHPLEQVLPHLAPDLDDLHGTVRRQEVFRDPKRARTTDEGVRYEDLTVFPLVGDDGEGAVLLLEDVTDRVRLEDLVIQSEKMLSVGGLAAGMAHEINNPLAGILQNTQVVRNRLLGDLPANRRAAEEAGLSADALATYLGARGVPAMLDAIEASGQRAARVVENMLSFSRKAPTNHEPCDLAALLERTVELASSDYVLKKAYDFRNIAIERHFDPACPPARCGSNQLQQVFLNVLRNGAQAMLDTDAPAFELRVEPDGPWVRVVITDNGPGMDEATRRRVFEPFFTTKGVGEGTGLGLSVSYFIVTENHGGEMTVTSAPGRGTSFVIRVPAATDFTPSRVRST